MCSFPWLAIAKPYFMTGTKAGTVIFHHLLILSHGHPLYFLWKRDNFSGKKLKEGIENENIFLNIFSCIK